MSPAQIYSGEGNGNPLWYSCLENSMDRRAWWATVRDVAESFMTKHTHMRLKDVKTAHEVLGLATHSVNLERRHRFFRKEL